MHPLAADIGEMVIPPFRLPTNALSRDVNLGMPIIHLFESNLTLYNDSIKRRSSFRSHLKKHKLDPKEVDLDSCVVVVKREEPEDPSELLQIPDIIRRSVSRSSSRSNTPLSALSPLSSLSDISEVSTPCEEPHKDFREVFSSEASMHPTDRSKNSRDGILQ